MKPAAAASIISWTIVDQNISFGSLPRGEAPMQFAAQYDNREVLRGYFKGLLEQWSMNFYEVKQFIAEGDMVVMQGFCSWTNKATGKTVETPEGRHLALSRRQGGRILRTVRHRRRLRRRNAGQVTRCLERH